MTASPWFGTDVEHNRERARYAMAFGARAAEYDRFRRSYPTRLIHDIWEYAGGSAVERILEVGAGSGKATVPLAKLGPPVDAIEPSAEMASILRSNVSGFPNVTVWTTSFESWSSATKCDLLAAAQSWHLIDPEVRLAQAAEVLNPGGALALFWNQPPQPADESVQRKLRSVLDSWGLDFGTPNNSTFDDGRRATHVPPLYRSVDFTVADAVIYSTRYRLGCVDYLGIVRTYPEYWDLSDEGRQCLDDQIRTDVFAHHDDLDWGHRSALQLARRAGNR